MKIKGPTILLNLNGRILRTSIPGASDAFRASITRSSMNYYFEDELKIFDEQLAFKKIQTLSPVIAGLSLFICLIACFIPYISIFFSVTFKLCMNIRTEWNNFQYILSGMINHRG